VRVVKADDPDALPLIRHDAAHVMAEAVQDLYPAPQVTIGPAIENGFYYDFHRDQPFTPDDLARIEARMAEIVAEDRPFAREEVGREEARARFEAWASASSSSCSTRSPRTSRSPSTTRAAGSTSAAGRTGRARGGSGPSS
jgi:threonyl-tRNA synthetase